MDLSTQKAAELFEVLNQTLNLWLDKEFAKAEKGDLKVDHFVMCLIAFVAQNAINFIVSNATQQITRQFKRELLNELTKAFRESTDKALDLIKKEETENVVLN